MCGWHLYLDSTALLCLCICTEEKMRHLRLRGVTQLAQVPRSSQWQGWIQAQKHLEQPQGFHHDATVLLNWCHWVLTQERGYCPRHSLIKAETAGCLKSFTEFSSKFIYNLINFIVLFQIFYFPVYKNGVKFTEKVTETQFTEWFCYL